MLAAKKLSIVGHGATMVGGHTYSEAERRQGDHSGSWSNTAAEGWHH
jgi:hypothetical protein